MRSRVIRLGFLAIALGLLAVALAGQAGTLWHEVQRLSAPIMALALALTLCGLVASLMVWRELLADLGSRLSGSGPRRPPTQCRLPAGSCRKAAFWTWDAEILLASVLLR